MSEDCLFCKIVEKQIPAEIVYEDQEMLAFRDIKPQAPVHLLLIPKKHIPTVNDLSEEDAALVGRMAARLKDLAKEEGLSEKGYRIVLNCNKDAGQLVFHLHFHLLGGRAFAWPPG